MYIPEAFHETRKEVLHELMRDYGFATLVSCSAEGPEITHLPFLLDSHRGDQGVLTGHLARANRHWTRFNGWDESVVIFQGPHAYISPSWYEAGLSVPTWNYAVVHAYGIPRIVEEERALREILEKLVQTHEGPLPEPWPMPLPEEYLRNMMKAIVGFEMEITRMEGKFKLSQNRPEGDRQSAAEMLQASGEPASQATADWMRRA